MIPAPLPRLALLLAVLLCRTALASTAQGSLTQPIVEGHLHEQPTAAVALLTAGLPFCSGVLVAPRVVLTAAHCSYDPDHTVVFFGGDPAQPGNQRSIHHHHVHPSYHPPTLTNDIALILLVEPAPAGTPFWRPAEDPSTYPTEGDKLLVFGYGTTTRIEEPWHRRSGEVIVDRVDPWSLRVRPGPSLTCTGDSGGPLVDSREGGPYLIGITSKGDVGCSDHSNFVRVDAYWEDFIQPYIQWAEAGEGASGGCSIGPGQSGAIRGPFGSWMLLVLLGLRRP